jgi:hypothetical protein
VDRSAYSNPESGAGTFFMVLAYLGIKRSYWFLVVGYFLHGIWEMLYPLIANPDLLPPDFDYFCITYDFIVGLYLVVLNHRTSQNQK